MRVSFQKRSTPYAPGNRGLWRKSKRLNRQEFVVVGWSDPEGPWSHLGALLLGYYESDGRLIYAGRVGTGMSEKTLATPRERLKPLAIGKMPLAASPPRDNRFGRPPERAKAHWVRPELVAEITYLSWPEDGLLRHTVFIGLRKDSPRARVRWQRPLLTRSTRGRWPAAMLE
jgi:ATP-dependent DNA ligase